MSVEVYANDDPNAKVARFRVKTKAIIVGLTRELLQFDANTPRNLLALHHESVSNGVLYIGGADVTVANGLPVTPNVVNAFDMFSQCDLYAISDVAGQKVRIFEAM